MWGGGPNRLQRDTTLNHIIPPLSICWLCAAALGKFGPIRGCLKPKARRCGTRCDADHTLLNFAVHPFRIGARPERDRHFGDQTPLPSGWPISLLTARRSDQNPVVIGSVAWAEGGSSQARSPRSAFASFRSTVLKPSVNHPAAGTRR